MDLRDSATDRQFRLALRGWLQEAVPQIGERPALSDENWPLVREYDARWQRMLFDAGYAGLDWPVEYGGRGATLTEQLIFAEETARAGAPTVGCNFVTLQHAGPTLIAEGSDEQRRRHLLPMLRGDEFWCQGFSEPEAGSDLAGLRTRAIRDGDDYVVHGSKIWSSWAHVADFCELLVRTDPEAPKHRGLSWLICPMDRPGIEVRPLRTLTGALDYCEVVFDGVRIPLANRVGAENDGWRVAMVTLAFERGTAFIGDQARIERNLELLARAAATLERDEGGNAWDDPEVRRQIGRLAARSHALGALIRHYVSLAEAGEQLGARASVMKLVWSELGQQVAELGRRITADAVTTTGGAELDPASWRQERLGSFWFTIAAGTSQIQRNIIGERLLALPKEPA
ncbi:MAG: acyl-CoA dehydrogenase family protein [Actinomycetota bacterium]